MKDIDREKKRLLEENTKQSINLDNKDDEIKQLKGKIKSQQQVYERRINRLVTHEAYEQINTVYNKTLVENNTLRRENRMLLKELKALGGSPDKVKKAVSKGVKVDLKI